MRKAARSVTLADTANVRKLIEADSTAAAWLSRRCFFWDWMLWYKPNPPVSGHPVKAKHSNKIPSLWPTASAECFVPTTNPLLPPPFSQSIWGRHASHSEARRSTRKGEAFQHDTRPMANRFGGMLRPNAEAAQPGVDRHACPSKNLKIQQIHPCQMPSSPFAAPSASTHP